MLAVALLIDDPVVRTLVLASLRSARDEFAVRPVACLDLLPDDMDAFDVAVLDGDDPRCPAMVAALQAASPRVARVGIVRPGRQPPAGLIATVPHPFDGDSLRSALAWVASSGWNRRRTGAGDVYSARM